MQDYRKLDVWTKAHELVLETYHATSALSEGPFVALVSQLRRAAAAVPVNIVEGCGHTGRADFARFLQTAASSVYELQYHLMLAHALAVLSGTEYARLDARTEQVRQMLTALLRKVRGQPSKFPVSPLPGNRFMADAIPSASHSSAADTISGKSERIDSASPLPNALST